jgi:hypothetical protein
VRFLKGINSEIFKPKPKKKKKIEHEKGSDTEFLYKNILLYTCKIILTVNIFPV